MFDVQYWKACIHLRLLVSDPATWKGLRSQSLHDDEILAGYQRQLPIRTHVQTSHCMSGSIAFNDMILCVVQELATINDEMIKIKVNGQHPLQTSSIFIKSCVTTHKKSLDIWTEVGSKCMYWKASLGAEPWNMVSGASDFQPPKRGANQGTQDVLESLHRHD